jgi:hypothetical protein
VKSYAIVESHIFSWSLTYYYISGIFKANEHRRVKTAYAIISFSYGVPWHTQNVKDSTQQPSRNSYLKPSCWATGATRNISMRALSLLFIPSSPFSLCLVQCLRSTFFLFLAFLGSGLLDLIVVITLCIGLRLNDCSLFLSFLLLKWSHSMATKVRLCKTYCRLVLIP